MSNYNAPIRDMKFVLTHLAGMQQVAALPGYEEATPDVVDAILEEAGRFAAQVLDPINFSGDQEGARWDDGTVTMPKGFKAAYAAYVENGWNGIEFDTEFGGQGMPRLLTAAVREMWKATNVSFSLCPLLTCGAIEALTLCGSDEQKQRYLHKMVAGTWTGTMNLTEPQAGSDLAAVRSRAEPQTDGSYRVFGQKVFITYGEHDMAENIIHLVLARLPDAPPGVKGISLFLVPKFLLDADGAPGERNDVRCVSIEHKLGIHASPTCVMAFGDQGGAKGYLVGAPNRGLEYMFVMMNAARFAVGLEGLALSERAYQHALAYARERVQSRAIEGSPAPVTIINHPDVRRMLMLMRSQTEAMRALSYVVAAAQDTAFHHPDADQRKRSQAFVDLMIPVVKGWNTENGIEIASLGVQIHGGMGFIEETGAAQHLRDARITTIYEGTTGIQANDLMGRKVARDGGACLSGVIDEIRAVVAALAAQQGTDFAAIHGALSRGADALAAGSEFIVANYGQRVRDVAVGAVPFLKLAGIVCGGWQMARAALVAQALIDAGEDEVFHRAKVSTTRFYADHVLSQAPGLAATLLHGGAGALALEPDAF